MINTISSRIGSSLLFQAIKQNLDDYHQGADRLARVVYQSALAIATSSSMGTALRGVQCLSTSSQNLVQGTLIASLATPIILNLSDLFALPIASIYRREIFAMNSNFSSVCYTIMSVAIAIFSCSSGVTMGLVALGALHAQPIIERLGLPEDLTSILSISNKLLGGVYGLCSGSYIIQSLSFFQTIRNIEKLSMLYIQNREEEIKSLHELENLSKDAIDTLSSDKLLPARYHLIRDNIITVPALPEGPIPDLCKSISAIPWKENSRAKEELACRLAEDAVWKDQWGSSFDIDKAIEHIHIGANNFAEYMKTCPDEIRKRAMWVLLNLNKKSVEDQVPYLIEIALHMHYCKEGKNAEIETTYGILSI